MTGLGTSLVVAVLALGIEALAGYPHVLYRTIGHPVTWIGALIGALDHLLNRPQWTDLVRRMVGVAALAVIVAVPVALAFVFERWAPPTSLGLLATAVIASTLVASRSLYTHVRDVAAALEAGGVVAGRSAVSKIVGRDPEALDEHGVARAAIESLAENASDGVVAPVFWLALLGLPGLVAYKAINTADSMIGHLTPRHAAFGWAAARLDDLVNLPASRLTGLLLALAACFLERASPRDALRTMLREAGRHRSPNAGWPESAMAGALGLKLAGPRQYAGERVDDSYMGDGRAEATAVDIRRGLRLAAMAWGIMLIVLAGLALLVSARG
ncbi:MAG: adenosylcobinamide-phosphate synthase CbiB [Hyphomicrobium sp.]